MGEEMNVRKAFLQAFQQESLSFEIPITYVSQSSLEVKIQLKEGKNKIILTLYTYQYILRITIVQIVGYTKEEANDILRRFVLWCEEVCRNQEYEAVVVEGENWDLPLKYRTLNALEVEVWNQYLQTTKLKQTDSVHIVQPKSLTAMIMLHTTLYDCFLQQEKEDVTFEFKKYFNMYSFYVEGFSGSLIVEVLPNQQIRLVEKNMGSHFVCCLTETDPIIIQRYLMSLFQDIRNKRRLLNLYDPPAYHFHQWVKDFLFSPLQTQELYEKLKMIHPPDELEERIAHINKQQKKQYEMEKKSNGGYFVLAWLVDLYVLVNVQDTSHVWSISLYETKEEALKEWKRLLEDEVKKKVSKMEKLLHEPKRNEG